MSNCAESQELYYFLGTFDISEPIMFYKLNIEFQYVIGGFWNGGEIAVIINDKHIFSDNLGKN